MIAYPNSGNISLFLLRVKTAADDLGNQGLRLVGSKEVVGMTSSITSKEFYNSKQTIVCLLPTLHYDQQLIIKNISQNLAHILHNILPTFYTP